MLRRLPGELWGDNMSVRIRSNPRFSVPEVITDPCVKYIARCPKCGKRGVTEGGMMGDGEARHYFYTCASPDCAHTWRERDFNHERPN